MGEYGGKAIYALLDNRPTGHVDLNGLAEMSTGEKIMETGKRALSDVLRRGGLNTPEEIAAALSALIDACGSMPDISKIDIGDPLGLVEDYYSWLSWG